MGAPPPLGAVIDLVVAGAQGRVGKRLLFTGWRVSGYFSHQLQAGFLGPWGQKEALEARGVGQQEEGPEAQGDQAREEEKEEEFLR